MTSSNAPAGAASYHGVPAKASVRIVSTEPPPVTVASDVQPLNVFAPMVVTAAGMSNAASEVQFSNADAAMADTFVPSNVIDVIAVWSLNAPTPMPVAFAGMTISAEHGPLKPVTTVPDHVRRKVA